MTLALWIDPTDSAQVTLSGSRVTDIADKSPEGNDVTEVSLSGPTLSSEVINGLDALTFSTGDYLTRVNASLTNMNGPDATVFAVLTDDNVVNSFGGIVAMTNAGFTSGWRLIKNTDFEGSFVSQTPRMNAPDSDTAGAAKIIVMQNDESADYQWIGVDGAWVDAEAQTGTVVWDQDLRIGVNLGSFHYTSGYIGEIIFNDAKLRSDDVQRMEGYLAHKYGSTASLPAGHPFKAHAPDILVDAVFVANFEGKDGETTYTADTGQVGTRNGTPFVDGLASKYGSTCYEGDGSSDYFEFADSDDWHFGSGDFTIECWVNPTGNAPGDEAVICQFGASGTYSWLFGFTSGQLRLIWSTTGSDAPQHTEAFTPVFGTWSHIAVSRKGGSTFLFADGALLGESTTISTDTLFNSTEGLAIGCRSNGGSLGFNGRIDGVRIVKGTALYTTDFTPPHRGPRVPVPAALIANFNGLDAATSYTSEDAGARTATFNGNAQLDDAQRKFGHTSLLLDGTGDYVTFPDSTDYEFGADDFTVEAWVRWSVDPTTTVEAIVGKWTTTGDQREWQLDYENATLRFGWTTDGAAGTFASLTGTFDPAIDTWYHVKAERANGYLTLWVDGVVVATAANTVTFFTGTSVLNVGGSDSGTQDFTGWIDGVRVVKGRGLESAIIPQDYLYNRFSDDSEVLLNFEGGDGQTSYVRDDLTYGSLTFNGTAQLDTARRARGTSSLYVPAATDYVYIPSDANLAAGTNDLTLELHVRFDSLTQSYHGIIDMRNAGSSAGIYLGVYTTNQWVFYFQGANRILGGSPTTGVWYHVVLERVNSVWRLFVDGVQIGSSYTNAASVIQNGMYIGSDWTASASSMLGHIDHLRFNPTRAIYMGDKELPCAAQGEPII